MMSEQWPVKPLEELCTVVNGGTPKSKVPEYWGGEVNWITPAEMGKMTTPYIDDTNRKITELGLQKSSAKLFPPHSVILSTRAPIGHLAINTSPMSTNQGCKTLVPNDELEHKYLYYFLYYNKELLDSLGTGATFKELSGKNLKEVMIPVPPIKEQQRIVSILDEAFRNIGRSKQQVELKTESSSELLQSIVESVFSETGDGWIDTTLGDISEIIMGQSPKGDSYNSEGFGVPLINGPVEFGPDPFSKTLNTKFTTAPTKMCEVNDLILCVRGSTTGRMNIAGYESCIGRGVAAIRSNEYQDWVNHYINFNRNHIYSLGTGATFPNISKDSITKIRIPIPPDNERKLLVSKLQNISFEIDLLDSKLTQELNSLEELKQSILQEAFTGKLTGGIAA
jgi:type I restriction enzyme, S subunit